MHNWPEDQGQTNCTLGFRNTLDCFNHEWLWKLEGLATGEN